MLAGIADLLGRAGAPAAEVEHVIHATTLVGNAIIERRRTARTALLTTAGFRDVLGLAREFRYDIYETNLARCQELPAL